jgi:hypothetical protein
LSKDPAMRNSEPSSLCNRAVLRLQMKQVLEHSN